MNVTKLPEGIDRRKCPDCGLLIDKGMLDAARFDFQCPRCGKHTLAEFVPDTPPKPTNPGGRKRLKKAA